MARSRPLTPTLAERLAPYALGALRIVAAVLLMQHGAQKILGWPADPAQPPMAPFVLASRTGVAGVLELFGGFLLAIGLLTRPVAFLLSGEMAFAYFIAHAPRGLFPILNRGELPALYCFVFLAISALGPGAFSIDGFLRSRRRNDWAPR